MPTRSFTTQCSNNLVVQSGGDGGDSEEDRRHFFSGDPLESAISLQLCFFVNENRSTRTPNPAKIAAATKPVVVISARD